MRRPRRRSPPRLLVRQQTDHPHPTSTADALSSASPALRRALIFAITTYLQDADAFVAALRQTSSPSSPSEPSPSSSSTPASPGSVSFRSRLLTFFGLISYAMYMTHLYLLTAYDHLRGPLPSGNLAAYNERFFGVLGLTILLCLLTRYLIELPATSLRRFVLNKPARKAEIESSLLTQ